MKFLNQLQRPAILLFVYCLCAGVLHGSGSGLTGFLNPGMPFSYVQQSSRQLVPMRCVRGQLEGVPGTGVIDDIVLAVRECRSTVLVLRETPLLDGSMAASLFLPPQVARLVIHADEYVRDLDAPSKSSAPHNRRLVEEAFSDFNEVPTRLKRFRMAHLSAIRITQHPLSVMLLKPPGSAEAGWMSQRISTSIKCLLFPLLVLVLLASLSRFIHAIQGLRS